MSQLGLAFGGIVVTMVDVDAGMKGTLTQVHSTVSIQVGSAILGAAAADMWNNLGKERVDS